MNLTNKLMRSFGAALVAASVLLLSACGGGSTSGQPEAGGIAAQIADEVTVQQALNTNQRLARLYDAEKKATRPLVTWSGLEEALGGPAATDAALDATAADLFTYADTTYRAYIESQLVSQNAVPVVSAANIQLAAANSTGNLVVAAGTGSGQAANGFLGVTLSYFEAGLFSRMLSSATYSQDVNFAPAPSSDGNKSAQFAGSHTREKLTYASTVQGDDNNLGLHLQVATALENQFCPDVDGRFTVKFSSDSQITRLGDSATGANTKVEVTLKGQLNDNAILLPGYDIDMRIQLAAFASNKGNFLDMTYHVGTDGNSSETVNRSSSDVSEAHRKAMDGVATVAMVYAMMFAKDAETAAQSGRCIKLNVDTTPATRTNLIPSANVQIIASPRSALDGTVAAGKITAKLTGGSSISPNQSMADATFNYVAPSATGASATVELESRSKRGVGKAKVDFTTGNVIQQYKGSMSAQSGIPGGFVTTTSIADVTWTLNQGSLVESLVYKPSGTALVTVSFAGCSLSRTLNIDPATSHLTVFGPDDRPDGRQKGYFAQVNTEKVNASLSCPALPQPMSIEVMGVFLNGCDSVNSPDPSMPRYTDIADLTGTRSVGTPCNLITSDPHTWSLKEVIQ